MTRTQQEEQFVYFQECLNSLHSAWVILDSLTDTDANNVVVSAAYRMAIIEYAKPFTKTFGSHTSHYLPNYHNIEFTTEQKLLHKHLLKLRKKVLAHSDIPVLDPKVFYDELAGQPFPLIIKNSGLALPNRNQIKDLIDSVIKQLAPLITEYHLTLSEK